MTTFLSHVTLPGNPTADDHAARKKYVDGLMLKSHKATLPGSGWGGSANAWTRTVTISNMNSAKPFLFGLPSETTRANADRYCEYGIISLSRSGTSITVSAVGTAAPSQSVEIEVLYYTV
jgi:hypothetical protein